MCEPSETVTRRLAAAGCVAAAEEAAELLAAAPDPATLETWLTQREDGVPLPWIVGATTFAGRRLAIGPGVYVPRAQTEELAARAAAAAPAGRSGPRPVHRLRRRRRPPHGGGPPAPVWSASTSIRSPRRGPAATASPRVVADLAAPVRGRFDVVTAVPPYVPTDAVRLLPPDVVRHEPRRALDGGDDGLDHRPARRRPRRRGCCAPAAGWSIELGGDQDAALRPDLAPAFDVVEPWHDDDGDLRGLAARR